ncbi:MAG: HAD family hydrolase [Pseudonocardiaceae bacterium]
MIFDCDGLLVDTHGHWDRAYTALFTRYQVPLRRHDRRRLVGLGLERLGYALADLLGRPVPPGVLAEQIFDTIVGAGDADHPKPAPDLYQETCRRLGIPCSLVVVLEDSLIGVQAARAAGTTVFAIPTLAETRSVAHRSFSTLADPELWDVLGLTPTPRH